MSYQIQPNQPIETEVRRIATELIDDAIARAEDPNAVANDAVHEVRKSCKRMRGLLRLVRPAAPDLYRNENARFRDAAAALSGLRDAEASIECYDSLLEHFGDQIDRQAMAPIRRALSLHARHLADEAEDLDASLTHFRDQMLEARALVEDWQLPDPKASAEGFDLLGPGLAKTYGRGREALAAAYASPSIEAFHEWRKRAKYLRYQLKLLRPAWPRLLRRTRSEVKMLGDLLGDDHDLAVLQETLPEALDTNTHAERIELLEALVSQRSQDLRAQARLLGERIYAEKPKALRKRIEHYWIVSSRAA